MKKKSLGSKDFRDAILMNLSKVFDILNHDLLIAKPQMVFNMTLQNFFKVTFLSDGTEPKLIVIW